jgi:SAM-dependent methyltransferase
MLSCEKFYKIIMCNQPSYKIWNKRFQANVHNKSVLLDDLWMDCWKQDILRTENKSALDLGCGCGLDSLYLSNLGFKVTSVDFSQEALDICQKNVPEAELVLHDISQRFPFKNNQFGIISANLSLHYFNEQTTHQIISDIYRCLDEGGTLMVCLNSTKDIHYGAVGEAEIEPNYYLSRGLPKRFFDRPSIDYFFDRHWSIIQSEETTIHKYGNPKVRWEIMLKKKK